MGKSSMSSTTFRIKSVWLGCKSNVVLYASIASVFNYKNKMKRFIIHVISRYYWMRLSQSKHYLWPPTFFVLVCSFPRPSSLILASCSRACPLNLYEFALFFRTYILKRIIFRTLWKSKSLHGLTNATTKFPINLLPDQTYSKISPSNRILQH